MKAAREAGRLAFNGFETVAKDGVHWLCLFDPDNDDIPERFIGECGIQDRRTDRYLIRVGTRSREASLEEPDRLFQQRGTIRAELQPASGAPLEHPDRRSLRDDFDRIRRQAVPENDDEAGWRTLLVDTELMTEKGVVLGGMLLFGTTPNRFLPHVGINAANVICRGLFPLSFPGTQRAPSRNVPCPLT